MFATLLLPAALLLSAAASAVPGVPRPASCMHPGGKKSKAPKTLEALKACQKRAKRALELAAQKRHKPLSDDQLDGVDDLQREETREFMATSHEVIGAGQADIEIPSSASGGGNGGGGNGGGGGDNDSAGDGPRDNPRGGQSAGPNGGQNDGAGKDDGGPDHESTGDRDTSEAGDIQARFTHAGVMPSPSEMEAIKAAMIANRGHATPEINQMISNIIADHKRPPSNP